MTGHHSRPFLIPTTPHLICAKQGNHTGGAVALRGDAYTRVEVDGTTWTQNSVSRSLPIGGDGGALYVVGGTSVNISRSDFYGNQAAGFGGAFSVRRDEGVVFPVPPSPQVTLYDTSIRGNAADQGGGAYFIATGNLTVNECVLRDNEAVEVGGAIRITNQDPAGVVSLHGSRFESNSVTGAATFGRRRGGAVDLENARAVRVTSCAFKGNIVTEANRVMSGGGALSIDLFSPNLFPDSELSISRCIFQENQVRCHGILVDLILVASFIT